MNEKEFMNLLKTAINNMNEGERVFDNIIKFVKSEVRKYEKVSKCEWVNEEEKETFSDTYLVLNDLATELTRNKDKILNDFENK